MKHICTRVLTLCLGIVIGFYFRGIFSPTSRMPPSNTMVSQELKEQAVARPRAYAGKKRIQSENGLNGGDNTFSITEIQTALERLKAIPDADDRAGRLKELLERWAKLDGRGAFAYVASMEEGEAKVKAMAIVAAVLSRADPQFLAEQTLTMPNNRSGRELVQDLAKGWAETDAHSALAWAAQLPEGFGKNDALAIVCSQLGKQNPEAVSEVISQLPTGDLRNSLISTLAAQWGSTSPNKAMEWANALPDSEKALAMSNVIGAWAQGDPLAAGTFAVGMPPGEMQNQLVLSTVLSWADQNPSAAAAWVLQFPDDAVRNQAIHALLGAWVNSDSSGALNWAKELPDETMRDVALKEFVESTAYWSPEKAAAGASLISDQAKQQESVEIVMRLWSQTDPTSAQNWWNHQMNPR